MNKSGTKTHRVLLALVALLSIAVGVQAYFLLQNASAKKSAPALNFFPEKQESRKTSEFHFIQPPDTLFHEMEEMQKRLDQELGEPFGALGISPGRMDFFLHPGSQGSARFTEKDGRYILNMELPGAEQPTIKVTVKNGMLTVSAHLEEVSEKEGNKVFHKERRVQNFEQSLTLPGPVKENEIQTRFETGRLTVILPKKTAS
ncbi:MAG: Hsp20/alpha crystallin family protein [Nitrospinaceae bacterium]